MTFIADDTMWSCCCFCKDQDEGPWRVVGLNDEKEVVDVSRSELLQSLHDLLVYHEYDSQGIFCVVRQMNAYYFEGSTFEGEERAPTSCS